MILTLNHIKGTDKFTIGKLSIDGIYECFTLEDTKREVKIKHETRIPNGRYEIKLRTFGDHHKKYSKYPFHKGMLWLQDVPGFDAILIHIGNRISDTSGCILVGVYADLENGKLIDSTLAYIALYKKVIAAFDKGEKVYIEILN